jgi:hypothetical protein
MQLLKFSVYIFAFVALLGITHAGTVVLTGTCYNYVTNNTIHFTLSNSGNDSAYNLILSPILTNATPMNSSYSINALNPGYNVSVQVKLKNISMQGTYADVFVLAYQQGFSSFSAIFPCLLSYPKSTTSEIYSTAHISAIKGEGFVNVSLFNAGRENITGNLSLILPPTLSYISKSNYPFKLSPYNTSNMSFSVKLPQGTASYTGAVVVSYLFGGMHYSNMATFQIGNPASSALIPTYYIIIIVGVVIIAIILILLLRSIRKKSKAIANDTKQAVAESKPKLKRKSSSK